MVRDELKRSVKGSIKSLIYLLLDPDSLLVENHEHNMIIGRQYEPFVIPCKPTSPKVKVELIKEDGEVTERSFSETVGFEVVSNETNDGALITCQFSLNDITKRLDLFFAVDRRFLQLITLSRVISSDL